MPHIFISTIALCANLYRCAPLIVGDKFSDPGMMRYLGAKVTTDYPEPNSPPMYVMFATLRSVLDALEEIGWQLKQVQAVQGYYTCVMYRRPEDKEEDVGQHINPEDIKSSQNPNRTNPDLGSRRDLTKEHAKDSATNTQLKKSEDKATNTPNKLDPDSMKNAPKPLNELNTDWSVQNLNKKEVAIGTSQPVSGGSSDELTDSSKETVGKVKTMPSSMGKSEEEKLDTTEAPKRKSLSTVDEDVEGVIDELVKTKSLIKHFKKHSPDKDQKEHKKKGSTDRIGENKELKKKPSYDKKKSSSESEAGNPYASKKMNRVSKRESTSSTVKEIFRD